MEFSNGLVNHNDSTKYRKQNKRKVNSKVKEKEIPIKNHFTAKNAERERSRVKSLRHAFQSLQLCLPSVPPNTKLSKLDILILATNYISHLTKVLANDGDSEAIAATTFDCELKYLHPVKKWPMRSRLYANTETKLSTNLIAMNLDETYSSTAALEQLCSSGHESMFINNALIYNTDIN